ncbi:MAG: 50S ribosomal protein L16 [Planctomycetota bacterium]|nr:50S ribosomal protein L16 [Planctomycetota bacterium]
MAMMPKRVKFRKSQRGKMKGTAQRGNYVAFGDYGLQAMEQVWLTAQQIEAGRVAATHFLRREGKLWVRVFPDKPVSGKPLETRMGKGKGEPEYWCCVVRPGRILYELGGVPEDLARSALRRVSTKMPIKTRMVPRRRGL